MPGSGPQTLQLHDTLTRQMRPVVPGDGKRIGFYGCGPTVYGPAHIGNFRTFIAQDVFRRVVELSGTPMLHVRNITDVDDKTIRDSIKAGRPLAEFTQYWTDRFHDDSAALNLLPPHVEPKATDHIPQQIKMIESLIARGHAYRAADGSVYFRVTSFSDYGKLSHLEDRELRLGAAQGATDSDEYSKDALADFALWKAHKPEDGANGWGSPWGRGRPGWHLECSAMSLQYLGAEFDVHGGGIDLIFPHHENEIAQSCCATGGHFARHWMHVAHLMVDGGKMSKSLGNLYTLDDLRHRGFSPAEVRYTLVSGHYRGPLNFTLHSLDSARAALQKLAKFEKSLRGRAGAAAPPSHGEMASESARRRDTPVPSGGDRNFAAPWFAAAWSALLDDLNVPEALGCVFSVINKTRISELSEADSKSIWLGLHFILDAIGIVLPAVREEETVPVPDDVLRLAEERWTAKQSKDWTTADDLRKRLELAGWIVKDGKESFTVVPKS